MTPIDDRETIILDLINSKNYLELFQLLTRIRPLTPAMKQQLMKQGNMFFMYQAVSEYISNKSIAKEIAKQWYEAFRNCNALSDIINQQQQSGESTYWQSLVNQLKSMSVEQKTEYVIAPKIKLSELGKSRYTNAQELLFEYIYLAPNKQKALEILQSVFAASPLLLDTVFSKNPNHPQIEEKKYGYIELLFLGLRDEKISHEDAQDMLLALLETGAPFYLSQEARYISLDYFQQQSLLQLINPLIDAYKTINVLKKYLDNLKSEDLKGMVKELCTKLDSDAFNKTPYYKHAEWLDEIIKVMRELSTQLTAKRHAQLTQPKAKPAVKNSATSFDGFRTKTLMPIKDTANDELINLIRELMDTKEVFTSAAERLPRSREMALQKIADVASQSRISP